MLGKVPAGPLRRFRYLSGSATYGKRMYKSEDGEAWALRSDAVDPRVLFRGGDAVWEPRHILQEESSWLQHADGHIFMVFGLQYEAHKFISNTFQMVTIPDADMGSRSAEALLSVCDDGGSIVGHPVTLVWGSVQCRWLPGGRTTPFPLLVLSGVEASIDKFRTLLSDALSAVLHEGITKRLFGQEVVDITFKRRIPLVGTFVSQVEFHATARVVPLLSPS